MKINERQLRQIIKESVKNVMNESYSWSGDVEPLKQIIAACSQIMHNNPFNDPDYDGDHEDLAAYDLYKWAKSTSFQAENFIDYNSDNVMIDA